jgi:hypothetical protein
MTAAWRINKLGDRFELVDSDEVLFTVTREAYADSPLGVAGVLGVRNLPSIPQELIDPPAREWQHPRISPADVIRILTEHNIEPCEPERSAWRRWGWIVALLALNAAYGLALLLNAAGVLK